MAQDHLNAATPESQVDSAQDCSVVLLQNFLTSNPLVKFIRYQCVDLSSIVRVRIVPVAFALKLATSDAEVAAPSPFGSACLLDDTLLWEIIQAGRDGLKPDWSSLKVCQYEPRHAVVMCYIREGGTQHQNGFMRCPRTCLQEMVSMAKNNHDLEFLVGFEIEFYIFDNSTGQPAPIPTIPSTMATSALRNKYLPMLEEMVLLLEKAGISVHYFHSEGSQVPGFFEISTGPLPPLEAVDSLIYSQETIKTVCSNNGLRATMHPFPFDKSSPAGQHMHISLSRKDSATADAFLAGLLERMPSLFAFGTPNYDSYARTEMMEYACWGTENRSCVVRKIRDAHWEIRFPDGTSNGYLTVASILAAGMDGVERGAPLTIKDKLTFTRMTEAERQQLGITISLPRSLKAALKALEEDEVLKARLGKDLMDRYLFVKRKEEEKFASLTIAERRELTMRNL